MVVHRITAYSKEALWNGVKAWFEGGPPASGAIAPQGSRVHSFPGRGGATWKIYLPETPGEERVPLDWSSFASPVAVDSNTIGYRWDDQLVAKTIPGMARW